MLETREDESGWYVVAANGCEYGPFSTEDEAIAYGESIQPPPKPRGPRFG